MTLVSVEAARGHRVCDYARDSRRGGCLLPASFRVDLLDLDTSLIEVRYGCERHARVLLGDLGPLERLDEIKVMTHLERRDDG